MCEKEAGDRYVGQKFKEARRALNVSRYDLARKLGINKKDILRYEIGTLKIPEDILVDLFCGGIFAEMNGKRIYKR